MRNDSQHDQSTAADTDTSASLTTLTATIAPEQNLPGKHRAPVPTSVPVAPTLPVVPVIPTQKVRERVTDTVAESIPGTIAGPISGAEAEQAEMPEAAPAIPHTARWRASHLPRLFAGTLLAIAVLGTAALGLQFSNDRTSDNFVSLVIGIVVVVVLWAMLIASTPQVVTVRASVLTIHNSGGYERFDLADGLQPVDVVGDPHSSKWAVLLHRADGSSVVLRRHDVVAKELDPIVRHYRSVANQRHAERSARFSR